MDIESTARGWMNKAENNATILTFIGTGIARANEQNPSDPFGTYLNMLNPLQSGAGPLFEVLNDLGLSGQGPNVAMNPIQGLRWKLWDAPHVPTIVGKYSAIFWAIGKYVFPGVIPEKYIKLAANVAKGAYAAALILPGSGPNSPSGNSGGSMTYPSVLNATQGTQAVQGNMKLNPTSGSLYTVNAGNRPIGIYG